MFTLLADVLFPPVCVQCEAFGSYLCPTCQNALKFYNYPIKIDLPHPALDQLLACCAHTTGAQKLVKAIKYRSAYSLIQTLTQLMLQHLTIPNEIEILTPIPLHPKRERERGFNQAELITQQLGHQLQLPYFNLLQRTVNTSPQAELNRQQRLTHLQGAFQFHSKISIENRVIGLIDDVATTGTTLNEAAKILKIHGAQKVYGIVFAHGR